MSQVSVLGAEARRLMLPGPVVAAAHCKTHQKLEIFGNFVASRSADPFVGRHFLLERHFAGEMISVGKARRCPFKKEKLGRPVQCASCAGSWGGREVTECKTAEQTSDVNMPGPGHFHEYVGLHAVHIDQSTVGLHVYCKVH